jgi:sugar lactone lactonase YvrE
MKWVKDAKEGIVVAGGHGQGNSLKQLSDPKGVIVDQLDQIYVADHGNHRVMRWHKGAKEGTIVIGGNERGKELNQLYDPSNLSFDRQGNLYVVDSGNDRIQKFEVE